MTIEVHTAAWSVKQIQTMALENDTIRFNYPIQRGSDQWNIRQKSLLIDSLANGYPIPPLYFLRTYEVRVEGKKPVGVREVLDGKQRITTTLAYLQDQFTLMAGLKPVTLDGIDYEISGKLFSELDKPVQDAIMGKNIPHYTMDAQFTSDEEIEELFSRMNNSTALTVNQKAKGLIGIKFSRLLNDVKEHELFTTYANFASNALNKDEHLGAILQTMMLIEGYEFKKFSPAETTNYSMEFKSDFDNKVVVLNEVEKTLDYLFEAFDSKQKLLLKKINFPMTVYLANKARKNEVDSIVFALWAVAFEDAVNGKESNIPTTYLDYTGVGSTDLAKVKGRVNEMERHFDKYCKMMPGVTTS